jgi:hypothetical protein
MWGARGSFPLAAAMVVMVAVGSWSLGHVSKVEWELFMSSTASIYFLA